MTTFNWLVFAGFLALGAAWTLYLSHKASSSQSYFVSDKNTPLFALIATLVMTELNTSTLVGFASMGYIFGPSASLLACVFLAGLMFYAMTVAKKWKQFDGITVTTYFTERYNPTIGRIAAIILLTTMLGFSANFLKSVTVLFQPLFSGLSPWSLSAIFCTLMLFITLRGGLKSIIRIDIISFLITLILFPLLYWFSSNNGVPHAPLDPTADTFPHHIILSHSIITMFTYILAPWYGQKIFAARCEKTAFKAVFISAIIISAIYALAILSAHWAAVDPNANLSNPQEAIPYIIHHALPPILQGVMYSMLFFVAATTIVGLWNTIASVFMAHHTKSLRDVSLKSSILITAGVAFVSYFGANLFIDQIMEKLILCNVPIAALSFSLLGGFYWKNVTPTASLASMTTGIVGGIFCYLYFDTSEYAWYWAIYVIPLHFAVGVLVTWLSALQPELAFQTGR